MRIGGIIAEYNPFHSGHQYQIEATRAAGVTHLIAVMSGHYVQRGEASIFSKWTRAEAALRSGVDLVLELPLPYATASAQQFALGGVALLDSLGCVDTLSFGSESGSLANIKELHALTQQEEYHRLVRQNLSAGFSYPKACGLAAISLGDIKGPTAPNDLLGVEYLRALETLHSSIEPIAIPRKGVEHDSDAPNAGFASASFIRSIAGSEDFAPYVPEEAFALYEKELAEGRAPAQLERIGVGLLAILRTARPEDLATLSDVSEGLENRIIEAAGKAHDLEELQMLIKNKRYSMSRIKRILLYALLKVPPYLKEKLPPYVRVLGFNRRGTKILQQVKLKAPLPCSTSLKELESQSDLCRTFARVEAAGTDLYTLCQPQIGLSGLDYTTPAIRV